jgi:hypothetical protein
VRDRKPEPSDGAGGTRHRLLHTESGLVAAVALFVRRLRPPAVFECRRRFDRGRDGSTCVVELGGRLDRRLGTVRVAGRRRLDGPPSVVERVRRWLEGAAAVVEQSRGFDGSVVVVRRFARAAAIVVVLRSDRESSVV